jgi:hypothetical protein
MTNKEMLKLAAKAAGIKVPTKDDYPYAYIDDWGIHRDISCGGDGTRMSHWNPLTDDGDAFRLMCALCLEPKPDATDGAAYCDGLYEIHHFGEIQTVEEATRLVIVRAAAEIGRKRK